MLKARRGEARAHGKQGDAGLSKRSRQGKTGGGEGSRQGEARQVDARDPGMGRRGKGSRQGEARHGLKQGAARVMARLCEMRSQGKASRVEELKARRELIAR